MPALVVWEPLIFGGDDLRLISSLILLLRLVQISMIIFIVYHIVNFNHTPEVSICMYVFYVYNDDMHLLICFYTHHIVV